MTWVFMAAENWMVTSTGVGSFTLYNVFLLKMGTFVDKKWKEIFSRCYIFAFWIFFFEKKGACTP